MSDNIFKNISVYLGLKDDLSPGFIRAGQNSDNFAKKLNSANSSARAAGTAIDTAGKSTENFGKKMLASTVAIAGGATAANLLTGGARDLARALEHTVGDAVAFNRAMQDVQSISGLTDAQIKAMSVSVIDLSKHLPQSAQNLAEALYPIASHGYTGAAALEVLTASAKAASAGLSDTDTAATILGSVLNAYGEGADKAAQASDALLGTVQHGVLNFNTLAETLSQVIGIASTAGVSINEVGAAIATMTRAGVTADQAGTELNRVIQQILKPTQDMATVYQQLGFQSGYAALQTYGLHGVLDKLRVVTGDNVTTMLNLFTDVRAARGAMALMTDQGKLYNDEFTAVGTVSATAGATQTSLAAQAKSAAYQFHLFSNTVHDDMIAVGQKSLPYLVDFVHGLEHVGVALEPVGHELATTGSNLGHILGDLTTAAKPFIALFGGAAVEALRGTGSAISGLTGFLADNKGIVIALALAYSAKLAVSLVETNYLLLLYAKDWVIAQAATVAGTANVAIAAARFSGIGAGLRVASSGLASLISPAGLATLGVAALAGEFLYLNEQTKKAQQYAASFTQGIDPNNLDAATAAVRRLSDATVAAEAMRKRHSDPGQWLVGAAQVLTPGTANTVYNAGLDAKALNGAYDKLAMQVSNVKRNAQAAAAQVGLLMNNADYAPGGAGDKVIAQFAKLAQASGIDLSKPLDQSSDAVKKLAAAYKNTADQSYGAAAQMASGTQLDIQALQDQADAIQKAGDAAATAFTNATDMISGYQPAGTAKDVAAAQKSLAAAQKQQEAAQRSQEQLGQRTHAARRLTIAQQQQQANAAQKVADATDKVTQAQKTLADAQAAAAHPDQQYASFLQDQLKTASYFVDGIQAATRKGINEQTISEILQAGPEKAQPILDAIAADHSGNLVKLVNTTEAKLADLNRRTVEDARLTERAITSNTDQLSRDLANAMSIDNLSIASGGKNTAADVAKALGISVDDANRIATEFGLTLAAALPAATKDIWKNAQGVPLSIAAIPVVTAGDTKVRAYAAGGIATGPGSSTSDSILARLSNGEGIVRAAAVQHYGGPSVIHALNTFQLPRFAAGGVVGRQPVGPGNAWSVGPQTVTNQTNINVDRVEVPDSNGFFREMDRRKRLANLSGRG